jgi:peptidoglycan hydrolase-like protein with peptidoglycan-binding domain
VDGIIGKNTIAAVKAFQTAHSLTADGIVGAKTWAALLQ